MTAALDISQVSQVVRRGCGDRARVADGRPHGAAGELVAIMGPSGSGKSTLLTIAGTLEEATSGRVCVDGQDTSEMSRNDRARLRRRSIGYVFQDFNLLAGLTAAENVSLPLELDGTRSKAARRVAMAALDELDLVDRCRPLSRRVVRRRAPAGGDRPRGRRRSTAAARRRADRRARLGQRRRCDAARACSVQARRRRRDRDPRRPAGVVGRPGRVPPRRSHRRSDGTGRGSGVAVVGSRAMSDTGTGGVPARRAVTRWAWRLFRRDWRQHLLIVSLLSVAVAAAIGLACAAYNVAPASGRADFGDADHFLRFDRPDPATLQAKLDAATEHFGAIDAIGHRPVPCPARSGRSTTDRSSPTARSAAPLLDLRSGRYPTADDEAAVTDWVADTLDAAIGSTIDLDGVTRTVVGIVENPSNLDDEFVLLPPSALAELRLRDDARQGQRGQVQSFRPPGDTGREVSSRGDVPESLVAAMIVLVVTTVVLFLVALIAAASFTVIAQRRLPQLGMMSAIGATEKHLRLTMVATGMVTGIVSAVVGAVIGLVGWVALAPRMAERVGYRIDASNIPWWLVITIAMLGDPDRHRRGVVAGPSDVAHPHGRGAVRSPAAPGAAAPLRAALASRCSSAASSAWPSAAGPERALRPSRSSSSSTGIVAVLAGVMLIGPIAIRGLARCAARVPIAGRLALRDLSRYQARSGAALAAIALAIGIPVAIVAATAAAENNLGLGNLSSNQTADPSAEGRGPVRPRRLDRRIDAARRRRDADRAAQSDRDPARRRPQPRLPPTARLRGSSGNLARSRDRPRLGRRRSAVRRVTGDPRPVRPDHSGHRFGNGILTNQRGDDIVIMDVGKPQSDARDQFEHLDTSNPLPDQYGSLPVP